jgi:hypothetical protein
MRKLFILAFALSFSLPATLRADTYSFYYYSLEWLIDASDTIVEVTLVPSAYQGNPSRSTATVKTVGRVYKQVGKVGIAEGEVLPTHLAQGETHRVLLFSRPDQKQPKERVVYCIYLAADKTPVEKKGDSFGFLPSHSSSWQRLAFSAPSCVAIDQTGKVLTDPDEVVKLIEARIKADPKRVSSEGRYIKSGPKVDDGDDHNLLIPEMPKMK